VELLPDGATLRFPEAAPVVTFALDTVFGAGATASGALHAGVHTRPPGIRRAGDDFGTVVNVASRVAAEAAAGGCS
jgi:class 3 adenylate cyclase